MLFVKANLAYLTIPFSSSENKLESIYLAFDLLNTYATNALPLCWGIVLTWTLTVIVRK